MAQARPNRREPESMADFVARRAREGFARAGQAASAAAHDAYGKAIRVGENLHLPTTDDVLAYGAGLLSGRSKPKPAAAPLPTRGQRTAEPEHRRPPQPGGSRTSEPQRFDDINRNPYVKGAAGYVGLVTGQVPGMVRGAKHMAEGVLEAAMFAERALNPQLDRLVNPPGQRAPDQVVDAGKAVANYANRVIKDPSTLSRDAARFGHQLNVDLNPFATPTADTAVGEFQRLHDIGKNQGELELNVAAAVAGAEGLQALGAATRSARSTRYLRDAGHTRAADYLGKPYKGMGDHAVFPRDWKAPAWMGGWNMPEVVLESPFNKLTFRHETQGGGYLRHVEVDDRAHGFRLPKGMGARGWSRRKAGIERLEGLQRSWARTPEATKTLLGGMVGAGGGIMHEPTDEGRE